MKKAEMTDQELMNKLREEPALRQRVSGLLDLIANTSGDFVTADSAEFQLIDELHHLGRESLTAWARKTEGVALCHSVDETITRHGKKKSTGTRFTESSRS